MIISIRAKTAVRGIIKRRTRDTVRYHVQIGTVTNMERQHPLIEAMRLRDKARRSKAHPKVLANLNKMVSERARKSSRILRKSKAIRESMDNGEKLDGSKI